MAEFSEKFYTAEELSRIASQAYSFAGDLSRNLRADRREELVKDLEGVKQGTIPPSVLGEYKGVLFANAPDAFFQSIGVEKGAVFAEDPEAVIKVIEAVLAKSPQQIRKDLLDTSKRYQTTAGQADYIRTTEQPPTKIGGVELSEAERQQIASAGSLEEMEKTIGAIKAPVRNYDAQGNLIRTGVEDTETTDWTNLETPEFLEENSYFQQLNDENKELLTYYQQALEQQDEGRIKLFNDALEEAKENAEPYWREQIRLFQDNVQQTTGQLGAEASSKVSQANRELQSIKDNLDTSIENYDAEYQENIAGLNMAAERAREDLQMQVREYEMREESYNSQVQRVEQDLQMQLRENEARRDALTSETGRAGEDLQAVLAEYDAKRDELISASNREREDLEMALEESRQMTGLAQARLSQQSSSIGQNLSLSLRALQQDYEHTSASLQLQKGNISSSASRKLGILNSDYEARHKELQTRIDDIKEDLATGSGDMTIDEQQDLKRIQRGYETEQETIKQTMADKGLSSSSIRIEAEEDLEVEREDIVESTTRQYARALRDLKKAAERGERDITFEMEDLQRKLGQSSADISASASERSSEIDMRIQQLGAEISLQREKLNLSAQQSMASISLQAQSLSAQAGFNERALATGEARAQEDIQRDVGSIGRAEQAAGTATTRRQEDIQRDVGALGRAGEMAGMSAQRTQEDIQRDLAMLNLARESTGISETRRQEDIQFQLQSLSRILGVEKTQTQTESQRGQIELQAAIADLQRRLQESMTGVATSAESYLGTQKAGQIPGLSQYLIGDISGGLGREQRSSVLQEAGMLADLKGQSAYLPGL